MSRQGLEVLQIPEGEQYEAGLGAGGQDVTCSVILFLRPGALVLPDDTRVVVVEVTAADDAHLGPSVHDQPVKIQTRRILADQDTLVLEAAKVLGGLGVDRLRIGIRAGRQINIWGYSRWGCV